MDVFSIAVKWSIFMDWANDYMKTNFDEVQTFPLFSAFFGHGITFFCDRLKTSKY